MQLRLNETVAANVRKLREENEWSRGELADRLGVGHHVVRDYERPRKGQPQRAFLWSEIVALCAVLDATIFELVLPEKGRRSVPEGWEHLPRVIPQVVAAEGSDEMLAHWDRDDRGTLMEILFGFQSEPEDIEKLIGRKAAKAERLLRELGKLLEGNE